MTLCQKHFEQTKKLAEQLDPDEVAQWLLSHGYFPEQYVLPPSFAVQEFPLSREPYFAATGTKSRSYKPDLSEIETISFPRSVLTVRAFGIIEPRIYHDLTWQLTRDWEAVVDCIFDSCLRIFSYSFPIPVTTREKGTLSGLRAGRMIYEFIEMAENDLVGEAYKYRFLLKTDVTNCYASIYTHAVSWAIHGKEAARGDRFRYDLVGTKIDKLLQNANDGRTNVIAIGPAICDIVSEILLAAVDKHCTESLLRQSIDFIGVRFKDDYRFLCTSEADANTIAKALQSSLNQNNLSLSEEKSEVLRLPEGLFRPWTSEYKHWSLKWKKSISYRSFESTLLSVLSIDERFPGTGVIDRFLSDLSSRRFNLKLTVTEAQARKTYSLLMLLKQRRPKSFPSILAIIEAMLNKYDSYKAFRDYVAESLTDMLKGALQKAEENEYDIIWILHFLRSVLDLEADRTLDTTNHIVRSVSENHQCFYDSTIGIGLFQTVQYPTSRNHLLRHLAISQRKNKGKQNQQEEDSNDGA